MNQTPHRRFFVGREIELAHLAVAVDLATTRGGRLIILYGEKGIGKTALLGQFAFPAAARGLRVLWGRWEHSSLQSMLQLHVFGTKVRKDHTELELAESIISLSHPAPLMIHSWPLSEYGKPADRVKTSPLQEPSDMAELGPFLLLIDDFEPSDRVSLLLLGTLIKEVRGTQGLIVVACNSNRVSLSADLEAITGNSVGDVDWVELRGLSRAEVDSLVSAVTGEFTDPLIVDSIFQASRGSPAVAIYMAGLVTARRRRPTVARYAPIVGELPLTPDLGSAASGNDFSRAKDSPAVAKWLECEGDYWTVTFRGRISRLRHLKGFTYIDHLIRHPSKPVHVLELAALGNGAGDRHPQCVSSHIEYATASNSSYGFQGETGPMLDPVAKRSYALRLKELSEELEEAKLFNDLGRISKHEEERAMLVHELTRSVGISGRDRQGISVAERARVSVTHAIKFVICRIRKEQPELGRLLSAAIRTGVYCSFDTELLAESERKRPKDG